MSDTDLDKNFYMKQLRHEMSQRTFQGELPLYSDLNEYKPAKMLYGKSKDEVPKWNDKKRKSMFDIIVDEDKKQGRLPPNFYFKTKKDQ